MSVLAGFLATLEMGLGTNALLYAASGLGAREPEHAIVALATSGAARFFEGDLFRFAVALTALLFVGGIAWAVVYTHVVEPLLPWPAWINGLAFSILPLLVSLTLLLPVLGGGLFGMSLGAGVLPVLGEALRNALFGAGLGTSYSLLYAARQPAATIGVPLLQEDGVGDADLGESGAVSK